MKGEFHIHTVASDGSLTVEQIFNYCKGNIEYLSITDHDTISESIRASKIANQYNLKAIIGVEVSSFLNNENVHILGFFKDETKLKPLIDFLEYQRIRRIERCYQIKEKLKIYFDIDLDMSNLLKRSSITRGSIANEIIRQGYKYSKEELFKSVIGDNCKAYVQSTKVEPKFVIDLIHQCCGKACLAHPTLLNNNDYRNIMALGCDAIEAIYPRNKEHDEETYRKYAKDNNLFISCGNDFHSFNDTKHANLLQLSLKDEDLEIFIKEVLG